MAQVVAVYIHILDSSVGREMILELEFVCHGTLGCKKDQALLIFNFLATLNGNRISGLIYSLTLINCSELPEPFPAVNVT